MIRVLNIQESITFGGVERLRLSLSKLLDKSKFELKIICTHHRGSLVEEITANNVEVITIGKLNSIFDFEQHRKVRKVIDEFKPHIIHGAVFEGVIMAAINGFIKRVPIIILEETSDPKNRSWRGNLLLKILSLSADRVIGVSPGVVEYLQNDLKIGKEKIVLINNGVKMPLKLDELEKKSFKNRYQIFGDEIIIGSVGRMLQDEHKRFSDLIKAFSILIKKGIKVKLLLVGDGPLKKDYEKLVGDLKIQDHVVFTGYQNQTDYFYEIFDVFSLVSAYEAFGLVLAEAMLHRLPVVATRVGGMKYIVDDGATGFLVEKYDVDTISEKLEFLCNNKEARIELGEKGYIKATTHYTEERYVKDIQDLYESLVNEKKIAKHD